VWSDRVVVYGTIIVYYEEIKGEIQRILMYECRCNERECCLFLRDKVRIE
jgi:hypothetical protein